MHSRTLQKKGYVVKSSSIGHWVDGRYGYLVAGYYSTRDKAVEEASKRISEAKRQNKSPAWIFT